MDEKKLFGQLEKMTKLLAASVVSGKTLREQVRLLSNVGLQPSEIAEITGKTPNLIRVTLHSIRKSKKS
ncbi:MAG: hypothetical protein KGH57_00905 [Candidatus Micrarchaeota archaeon]|nr:hypothetical protein [Candidatus Micrarchaeota archaeon]